MRLEKPKNENYCATIVVLDNFVSIPKADKIKSALIFGNNVIVSKEAKAGNIGVFFPAECQLEHEFVSANNLYRKSEFGNVDPLQKGYFEKHCRIKCAKFLGVKSEGLWVPISSFDYLNSFYGSYSEGPVSAQLVPWVGKSFDKIGTHEICRKYVPKSTNVGPQNKAKVAKLADSIVDNQWRFHFDTENLRKNIHKISPFDIISISDKEHGTSAIIGKPLVIRKLTWYERLLKKIGVRIQEHIYGLTYSSRKVIKAVDGVDKSNGLHFYTEDIWGIVAKEISDKIPNSFLLYGEIVGYTPTGRAIQSASGGRAYHYGCAVGEHRFAIYRVVTTNNEGLTLELSWPQMKEFCTKYGLEMVKELYYGPVSTLVPYDSSMDIRDWQENLLKTLGTLYVHDQDCVYNKGLPAEGIVIRVDHLNECSSYKLKNFRFLMDESVLLDAGVADMETAESEEVV